MRPYALKTRIFIDGGDPAETEDIQARMGFLDGQTTNPTLIGRNPEVRKRLEHGRKFSPGEILDFYRDVVTSISRRMPNGSISIEVFADESTSAETMLRQGMEMFSWIPSAHIKFPSTSEGIKAAERAVKEGLRVNMTLCFSQEQAAAVYAATRGAKKGQVFVSPFIGRLDDRGENGMDLIANIIAMYKPGDGHVELLTASVRKLDHILYALRLGSDIISAPYSILKEWVNQGLPVPDAGYLYNAGSLRPVPYREISLENSWHEYDIRHELTVKGIERFSSDWNSLIAEEFKKTA
jgi:transaldolase